MDKAQDLTTFYGQRFDYRITILFEACFFLAFALVILRIEPRWPRFWIVAGTATYPLYLLHQHIGFIGMNRLANYLSPLVNLSVVLFFIFGLTLLVSEFLEPIARRQLRKWLDKMPSAIRSVGRLRMPRTDSVLSPNHLQQTTKV
jgi:peptidoglycan/LPS O-acetylase OafA/YrhL